MLYTPHVDVSHTAYCGPRAIAALTGVPISRIEYMIKCRRHNRTRPVLAVYPSEVTKVLKALGCKVTKLPIVETTLGRFNADTKHINTPFLVLVTGHYTTLYKGVCSDHSMNCPNWRVKHAWKVIAPTAPKFGAYIPLPKPTKPKPDPRRVRYENTLRKIKAWETKAKRAKTALRKLNETRKYYEKLFAA